MYPLLECLIVFIVFKALCLKGGCPEGAASEFFVIRDVFATGTLNDFRGRKCRC